MPTATAGDIINRALVESGVNGQATIATAGQAELGLNTLNGMVDSWKIDGRYIFCRNFATYALTASQQTYDIGLTAAAPFNVARPSHIINANLITSAGIRFPLPIIDDDQRASIGLQNQSASMSAVLNYKRSYPNGQLWLWPKPAAEYSLELETDVVLDEFALLTTPFSFPPGYYDAIMYSLAERFMTPAWGGFDSPLIHQLAAEARKRIESLNLSPPPLQTCDPRAGGVRRGGNGTDQGITAYSAILGGAWTYRAP